MGIALLFCRLRCLRSHCASGQLRGKTVAVKTIDANWKSDGEVHTKILDDFRNECAVMTKLLHPNVR